MFCCGRCVLSSPTTLPLFVLELTIALFFICLLFSLPMSTGFSYALSPGCSLGQLDTVSGTSPYCSSGLNPLLSGSCVFLFLVLHLLPKQKVCGRYNMWGIGCLKVSLICYPSTDRLAGNRLLDWKWFSCKILKVLRRMKGDLVCKALCQCSHIEMCDSLLYYIGILPVVHTTFYWAYLNTCFIFSRKLRNVKV